MLRSMAPRTATNSKRAAVPPPSWMDTSPSTSKNEKYVVPMGGISCCVRLLTKRKSNSAAPARDAFLSKMRMRGRAARARGQIEHAGRGGA
eukprot:5196122-Prymnesium_polylepis.3